MRLGDKDVYENVLQTAIQCTNTACSVTVYSGRDTTALQRDNTGSKRNCWALKGERLGREKDQKKGVWGEISPIRDWTAKEDSSQMWGSLRKLRAWGWQVSLQRHQILGGSQSHPGAEQQPIGTGRTRPTRPAQGQHRPGLTAQDSHSQWLQMWAFDAISRWIHWVTEIWQSKLKCVSSLDCAYFQCTRNSLLINPLIILWVSQVYFQ